MAVTAKDVAELRARTGAGMMDCKKALEESNGDMNAAADLLRKKAVSYTHLTLPTSDLV